MVGDQRLVAAGVDRQLVLEALEVAEAKSIALAIAVEPISSQALGPELERIGGANAPDDSVDRAVSSSAGSSVRELEEGEVSARTSLLVGVEQVIHAGLVLIHRLLHHAQAHEAGIKIDVALGIGRDARYVVNAFEPHPFEDSDRARVETPERQTGTPRVVRSPWLAVGTLGLPRTT